MPYDLSYWIAGVPGWVAGVAWPFLVETLKHIFGIAVTVSLVLSLFFMIGIIYCVEGLKKVRNKEEEKYDRRVEQAFETVETGDTALAHRWDNALTHVESTNPNDWRQAIIEADIVLDDLLTKMGYRGESIGEKLKRVQPGEMKTLQDAWDAHLVRNRIAHDGSSFDLNQIEAKRTIALYRKVFDEFFYI